MNAKDLIERWNGLRNCSTPAELLRTDLAMDAIAALAEREAEVAEIKKIVGKAGFLGGPDLITGIDAMSVTLKGLREDGTGCICRGNWRAIVKEAEPRIGRRFKSRDGKVFSLAGVMHGNDDYYYVMWSETETRLLSCVGAIENPGHGYEPIDAAIDAARSKT